MSNPTYKHKKHLGLGGFGCAELVEYQGEEVVLKRIRLGTGKRSCSYEDCENEADILMKAHCRYLTHFKSKFIEERDEGKYYCILMEYCKYQTLRQILNELQKRKRYLSTEGVLKYFTDIVMGVKYLHSHNILHRDLKPGNIFVTNDNVCILGDFGLSKVVNNIEDLQRSVKGTTAYMCPEIFKARGYNMKADIWSLGCVLYEICTLQYPFEFKGIDDNKKLKEIISIPFGALNKSIPSFYPIELYHIILKCLQINPDDRPSIDDILKENIIQDFINKDCGEFLFQLDTEEYDDIVEDFNRIDYYCSKNLESLNTYSYLITSIFDKLMDVKLLDNQNEVRIFKIIEYVSCYIGRCLLSDPHAVPHKMIYQKLNTYESCKGWEEESKIINLISYIIKFLYVHHYYDEAIAILEELRKEKDVSNEDKNLWIEITKNPTAVDLA